MSDTTSTTNKDGHIYMTVPETEAPPPAYAPASDMKKGAATTEEEDDQEEEEQVQREGFELGLFECINHPALCVSATFFDPCLFARTSATMAREPEQDPTVLHSKWSTYLNAQSVGYLAVYAFTNGVGNVFWRSLRRAGIREKYNIKGNLCLDFVTSLACEPCALAQEDYEVTRREQEILTKQFKRGQAALASEYMV